MRERIGTINASFPVFQNTFHVLTAATKTSFGDLIPFVLVEELFIFSSCSKFTQQTKLAQKCFQASKIQVMVFHELVSVLQGNISGFIMVFRSILRSANLFKTIIKPGMQLGNERELCLSDFCDYLSLPFGHLWKRVFTSQKCFEIR